MSTSDFTISVDGLLISGRRTGGRGMTVLMLHGSGASKDVFSRQFDSALGKMYDLVAIDLPGHGASQDAIDPAQTYTIRGLAALVGEVVDRLELSHPAIYGWSLGGHVAIELLSQRSDLAGLAIGGTPPIGRGPLAALRGFHTRWDMLLTSKESFSPRDAERYLELCYGESGTTEFLADIKRADGRLRKHVLRSLMRGECADQRRVVETNPIPLAVIDGVDDPIVRRSYVEHLNYAALWGGQCHTISGAAHAPFWEQPDSFNRLLHRFLKDIHFDRLAAPLRAARAAG